MICTYSSYTAPRPMDWRYILSHPGLYIRDTLKPEFTDDNILYSDGSRVIIIMPVSYADFSIANRNRVDQRFKRYTGKIIRLPNELEMVHFGRDYRS